MNRAESVAVVGAGRGGAGRPPAAAPRTWQSLLDGSEQARALRAAERIAAALVEEVDSATSVHPAIASNAALLMHYLARSTGRAEPRAAAERLLARAIDGVAEEHVSGALHGGLSGIAWVASHLQGGEVGRPEAEEDDPVDPVDGAILEALDAHDSWPGDFDLISGLAGIGVHALQRRHRPDARLLVDRAVSHLARLARWTERGAAFWRAPELLGPAILEIYPAGCVDLGLAHGQAGVIAWLADLHRASLARDDASRLLDGCVTWLLGQPAGRGEGSLFPSHVGADGKRMPGRLAWCYGDPGIAVALYKAASARRNAAWRQTALDIALRAARLPPEQTGVVDPRLCHGALGLAHIDNRLWQATGHPELAAAARRWYARALEMGESRGGFAGSVTAGVDAASPGEALTVNEGSLISGTAGMGLALLAAATAVEPGWDDLLLLGIGPEE